MTGWRASRSTTGRSSWKAGVGTLAAGIAGFAAGLLLGKLLKPAGVGDDAGIDVSDDYRRELHIYLVGFGLALALTLAPFALVYWSAMPRSWLLIAIGAFALVQVVVHFRCFLHINPPKQKTDDLQLILFSSLLLLLMAGGTVWILHNLALRMH